VVPLTARFGELVSIYGVGLDTTDLFTVTVDGFQADVFSFTPLDPEQPNEFGRLTVWMPPPAERRSTMTILGVYGGVVFPESLTVIQRDIYEPNDTMGAPLGDVLLGFANPALAFEVLPRDGTAAVPADWYTFTNAIPQDRTLLVFSEMVGAETFQVFVTDSLGYNGATDPPFFVGSQSWTIGPESYICGGKPLWDYTTGNEVSPAELPFPFTLVALEDLPAGTYHVLAPYLPSGEPARYEMLIGSLYLSVLDRDAAEENDYCDVAAPLNSVLGSTLTIDNFRDVEWFQFNVPAGGRSATFTTSAVHEDADLDMYVIGDWRSLPVPGLPLVAAGVDVGQVETLSIDTLVAGDYFLLLIDFPGVPTEYTLDATFGPLPAPGVPLPASAAVRGEIADIMRAKREQSRVGRATVPRPRPHR
jgi:hypothetical protein